MELFTFSLARIAPTDEPDEEIYVTLKQVKERIAELEAENADLRDWKESALAVEREWDIQAIGKLIGVKWGASIRKCIEPYIKKIQEENTNLRSDVMRLVIAAREYQRTEFFSGARIERQAAIHEFEAAIAPFEKVGKNRSV